MPPETDSISGSVIQRSFVPAGLGIVLNVVTIPIEDVASKSRLNDSNDFLKNITAEILGIPKQSLLDEVQYRGIKRYVTGGQYFDTLRRHSPFGEYFYYEFRDLFTRIERQESSETSLATDSLNLMASPLSPTYPMSGLFLGPSVYPNLAERNTELDELGVSIEGFQTGLACLFASINPDYRVSKFREDVQTYDIPSGQSPATTSESLLQLIRSSRSICLAPMIAGSTAGVTQLGQGSYINALLTTGTGAGMTLVLIATVAVSEWAVRYIAQRRALSGRGGERLLEGTVDDESPFNDTSGSAPRRSTAVKKTSKKRRGR